MRNRGHKCYCVECGHHLHNLNYGRCALKYLAIGKDRRCLNYQIKNQEAGKKSTEGKPVGLPVGKKGG